MALQVAASSRLTRLAHGVAAWARLGAGLLLALVSLTAVVDVPLQGFIWVTLMATERSFWCALVALLLVAVPGWWRSRLATAGALLGLLACVLLAVTPLRGALLARHVPAQLSSAFGPPASPEPEQPFSWAQLALGQRPQVQPRTLTFASKQGEDLRLDFYPPPPSRLPPPLVILVHGGAWAGGERWHMRKTAAWLAAHGYAAASVDYRLAPRHHFPAPVEDVHAATAFLKARSAELGFDPQRIVLLGSSAGGQVALIAAYTAADPAIRGVIDIYGPTDMALQSPLAGQSVLDLEQLIEDYLGASPELLPQAYRASSPLSYVGASTPPTLLIHGARDTVVHPAHAHLLAHKLAQAGRPHALILLPWATHGCEQVSHGPSWQIAHYSMERFVAAVTR